MPGCLALGCVTVLATEPRTECTHAVSGYARRPKTAYSVITLRARLLSRTVGAVLAESVTHLWLCGKLSVERLGILLTELEVHPPVNSGGAAA